MPELGRSEYPGILFPEDLNFPRRDWITDSVSNRHAVTSYDVIRPAGPLRFNQCGKFRCFSTRASWSPQWAADLMKGGKASQHQCKNAGKMKIQNAVVEPYPCAIRRGVGGDE